LASAQKAKEDGVAEAEALVAKKAEADQVLEQDWQALVAATFQGKDWRKRAKSTKTVQELLRSWSAAESLLAGVGAAVALKPDDRGAFAAKSIEYASGLFEKELKGMGEKIAGAEDTKAKLEAGIADAEAAVKSAEEAESEALAVAMNADNAWAEAESAVRELQDSNWPRKFKELDRKLDAAKASLAAVAALVGKVVEMDEREEVPEPAPQEEAAAEAAAPEEGGAAA